jgi:mannose-6-phosphate isomerase-like protein (cupin superfamily)
VKFLDFGSRSGFFTNPATGSQRAAAAHRKLKPGETFTTETAADAEQLLFVWKGGIQVMHNTEIHKVGEKDTVFISGPAKLEVRGDSSPETVVIQVQAPPQ